jgi:hypothetical protein
MVETFAVASGKEARKSGSTLALGVTYPVTTGFVGELAL